MHAYVRKSSLGLALVGSAFAIAASASAVSVDWTTVANPGNACDTQTDGCFGAVAYAYAIGTYEVTNVQYAEFLNAVADTDPNAVYNSNMTSGPLAGITRSGSPGTFSYAPIAGREDMPVSYVSFYDALRFANWLHNGQPDTGAQSAATSEDGAYTFSGATAVGPRKAGATIFLPTEDEWYKAAYYAPASASYFDYPAGSNTQIVCAAPTATPNRANCTNVVLDVTDSGSYAGSASSFGTFDQGGNLYEWNETITSAPNRGLRGGSFGSAPEFLAASMRLDALPSDESFSITFRVAPEPGRDLLLVAGVLALLALERRNAQPPREK